MLDEMIDDFCARNELKKNDDDYIVNNDTQVGIEFAFEQMNKANKGKQLVSEKAIAYLFQEWPSAYKEFYKRLDT